MGGGFIIKIIREKAVTKGKLLRVKVKDTEVDLLLTKHFMDAIADYNFAVNKILDFLLFPDEVIRGHGNRFVAHKKIGEHLARVVYQYENAIPVRITFYIARTDRYYKGGVHEDKILS